MSFLTYHGLQRIQTRQISLSDIDYVLQHGTAFRKQREYFYCLAGPARRQAGTRLRRLVLILTPDHHLKTAYFHPRPLKHLRQKCAYNRVPRSLALNPGSKGPKPTLSQTH